MDFIDYYELLEVSPKASKEVIELAYKALAKKYHPDTNRLIDPQISHEKMSRINEARAVLTDDLLRRRFDVAYQSFYLSHRRSEENSTSFNNSTSSRKSGDKDDSDSSSSSSFTTVTQSPLTPKPRKNAIRRFAVPLLIMIIAAYLIIDLSSAGNLTKWMQNTPSSTASMPVPASSTAINPTSLSTTSTTSATSTAKIASETFLVNNPTVKYTTTASIKPVPVTRSFKVNYSTYKNEASISEVEVTQTGFMVDLKFIIINNTRYYLVTDPVYVTLLNRSGEKIGGYVEYAASMDPKKYDVITVKQLILDFKQDIEVASVKVDFEIDSRF